MNFTFFWTLGGGPEPFRLADSRWTTKESDNGDVAQDWALAGCGLILESRVDAQDDLVAGRPARVRLFLDAMAHRLNQGAAG